MTYVGYLTSNPFFWSAVTGIVLGGAVASISRRTARSRRPSRARSRKWTVALLFLTVAVATGALGIILPSTLAIVTLESLYVLLGALVFAGLALRFPRAAGVPALLVSSIVIVTSVAVMREWFPVRDDAPLAVARVLSADEDRFFVELADNTPGTSYLDIIEVPGREIAPVVDVLEISEYLFFLGGYRGLRLAAVSDRLDDPPPVSPTWLAEVAIETLPLLTIQRETVGATTINLLKTYLLVGQPYGDAVRVEVNRE